MKTSLSLVLLLLCFAGCSSVRHPNRDLASYDNYNFYNHQLHGYDPIQYYIFKCKTREKVYINDEWCGWTNKILRLGAGTHVVRIGKHEKMVCFKDHTSVLRCGVFYVTDDGIQCGD